MCQNYGHSDLTLDLIINRNSAAASASCQMQRRKGFEVITCKSSGLMAKCLNICVEMETHQSVFRWG